MPEVKLGLEAVLTVLNKEGDSAFGMLQGLWSSGDPCDVGISYAGGRKQKYSRKLVNLFINRHQAKTSKATRSQSYWPRYSFSKLKSNVDHRTV